MKNYWLFIFILYVHTPCFAQYDGKGVIIEDRLLTWDDFRGRHESDAFKALTYTIIDLQPRAVRFSDPIPDYHATCYFLPKESSVSRKFLKEEPDSVLNHVLNHEQGHYNLARIATTEINNILKQFTFNQRKSIFQADSIYRAVNARLRNIQTLYDKESNHSQNRAEQSKWNILIEDATEAGKLPE
jgi:hypothetical protein